MAKPFMNVKKISSSLIAIDHKIERMNDIAITRSLNTVVTQGRNELVTEVADEYGYPKNSIKRRVIPIKATRSKKVAGYSVKSVRLAYPKPRKIKKGISYAKQGGGRAKITERPRGGATRPFLVGATKGKYGTDPVVVSAAQKKVAVYRKYKGSKGTTTFLGSSVPKMIKTVGIDDKWLIEYVQKNIGPEYKKQLKTAKYTGGR